MSRRKPEATRERRAKLPPWKTAQLSLFPSRRETCERCGAILALRNQSELCSSCRDGEQLDREQEPGRARRS